MGASAEMFTWFIFLTLSGLLSSVEVVLGYNIFNDDVEITWGNGRGNILNHGKLLTLSLDQASGSGFQSKNEFLYGKFDVKLKLVPGNSAGTVTTFYLRSQGSTWDELDFEFLGNSSGEPYIVHTNVYTRGQGNREQQFYLWFDPTLKFHTYSILWNPGQVVFSIDGKPIRQFKNLEPLGIPFPREQPMRVYSSIWNADDWATRGGLVKTNWTEAPFMASFVNFESNNACVWSNGASTCNIGGSPSVEDRYWLSEELDLTGQKRLFWVRKKYMVYDYCTDTKRFPQGLPIECNVTTPQS